MNWLIKILSLIIFALLGGVVYAITANILIASGAMTSNDVSTSFGYDMTFKAVIIWFVCVCVGIGSLFIKQKWRYALTAAPTYMPALFAIIYALSVN